MTKHQVFKTILSRASGEADARMTISTPDVDRDGDILVPEGIVLDDYWRNPVVLFSHDHYSIPVARTLDIDVVRGVGVQAAWRWLKNDEQADRVRNAFEQGVLNAASVGFQPLASEPLGNGGFRYTKWSLLEFSICPLPANPHATRMLKSLGLSADDDTTDVCILVDPEQVEAAIERAFKANPDAIRVDMDSVDRAVRAGIQRGFAAHGTPSESVVTIDDEVLDGLIRDAITHAIQQRTGRLQ